VQTRDRAQSQSFILRTLNARLVCYSEVYHVSKWERINQIILQTTDPGDHYWSMKNLVVLTDIHFYACYRRNYDGIFKQLGSQWDASSWTMLSHCDPCCLETVKETVLKSRKIRRSRVISGEMVGLTYDCRLVFYTNVPCVKIRVTIIGPCKIQRFWQICVLRKKLWWFFQTACITMRCRVTRVSLWSMLFDIEEQWI